MKLLLSLLIVLYFASTSLADCTLTPNLSLCTRTDTTIFTRANQNGLVSAVDALATNLTSLGLPKPLTVTNAMLAGSIDLAAKVTGNLPVTNLGSGTGANAGTFWRGDGTWGAATGTGGGTVTNTGALTASALMLGNAGSDLTAAASLGTTTTLLHGNAAGAPSFGQVSMTADVTGVLPTANGGTGIAFFTAAGPTVARIYTFPDAASSIAASSNNLSFFAATTSTQLRGVLSDETGTGAAVFATAPTLGAFTTTGVFTGSAAAADMEWGSTSGAGSTVIDLHSSGNNTDYDSRIIATGGTVNAGNGTLELAALKVILSDALPQFIIDPNAASGDPYFTAPFSFRAQLSDTHVIGIVPNFTIGVNTTTVTKGGMNINIGRDTPIAAGKKGDFYGYTGNIITNQTNADKGSDGVQGVAFNITNHGGIRSALFNASLVFDTLAPENEQLIRMSISKNINGENEADGVEMACNVGGAATVACNGSAFRAVGAWKYGLLLAPLTQAPGATPWTNYISMQNFTTANVAVGIAFADNKVDLGMDMRNNDIGFLEKTAPAAPAVNRALVYSKDNGSGKTQMCAIFNTGAEQCFATQP